MSPVILLVDDNKEITDFLKDILETKYSIITASDGEAALNSIEKQSVHLVISDIMMPVMDGFELCKKIKANSSFAHIPVILLTAKKTLEARIDGLELGADAYIEKPFSPKHLQAQITNLLDGRNKLKEFFASSPLAHIKTLSYIKEDKEFLDRINEFISRNLTDPNLEVERLAAEMNMSRTTFYRKIKEISDLSPNDLINLSRLKKAAELLLQSKFKIYEISDMVGFTSQHHFSRIFLKHFGLTPSEFQSSNG